MNLVYKRMPWTPTTRNQLRDKRRRRTERILVNAATSKKRSRRRAWRYLGCAPSRHSQSVKPLPDGLLRLRLCHGNCGSPTWSKREFFSRIPPNTVEDSALRRFRGIPTCPWVGEKMDLSWHGKTSTFNASIRHFDWWRRRRTPKYKQVLFAGRSCNLSLEHTTRFPSWSVAGKCEADIENQFHAALTVDETSFI